MNIVYIHAHDAGRYIQPYGYAVPTPRLQQFAQEGMLFRQAFCSNPTCSPSRACLMTGQSAHENGMLGLAHRGFRLKDYGETLVQFLGEAGYHTALSGIQHIALEPYAATADIGYSEILTEAHIDSNAIATAAEDFLGCEHQQPFFLDVGFFPPHRIGEGEFPADGPAPDANYVRAPAHLPDTAATREDFAAYMASVQTFDTMFGRVVDAIEANGLAEETLIIATTDHGIAFPGMKCRLTDHGLGVMLMLRGPNGFSGGKLSDSMVTHLDLFPTICEVVNLPIPDRLQGRSLCALAREPEHCLHERIFAEVNVHAAYEPMRAVRSQRWKYIRHYAAREHVILPNCDNGLSKDYLCDHGWAAHVAGEEELYDLLLDPQEANNLVTKRDCAPQLESLRTALHEWMLETQDPLLRGPLDLSDKVVTSADAYSPAGAPRGG
ncbi:MAG TPA: sulfatase [Opitutae bacterium]|nr:sulfatase [Puniceicoccaceae bacterium]HBR95432.1 sulfatase [Opitutae bacterium]|tara:strand:+ start:2292 stop:3602 length:1311 start_codon:yes stop_codon:yes gene_type:complete